MGTRSMATFVETRDLSVLIDPAVALGPRRYGLPPHPLEIKRQQEHWHGIRSHTKRADVLIVTHYHYDHHDPDEPGIYENKTVLVKHPEEMINQSQRKRAAHFLDRIKGTAKAIEYSDAREFRFGETTIRFSPPVEHGPGPKLGWVTEVLVDDNNYRFIHTSDVEGPSLDNQAAFILENRPNLVFLDGPMSYMLGFRFYQASMDASLENMCKIIRECPLDALVVDHHFLRDPRWKERLGPVIEAANGNHVKVQTAAEFAGKPVEILEARRRELWKEKV